MKRTAFSPHNELYIQHLKSTQKHNMTVQHYHDAYEIYLLLKGKRYHFFDNICYVLEPGDLVIMAPFDIHYSESREAEDYERYVLNFKHCDLSPILTSAESLHILNKLKPCVTHLDAAQTTELFQLFAHTEKQSLEKGFLSHKLLCASLLQLLDYVIKCTDNAPHTPTKKISSPIAAAIEYINTHYQYNIALDEICKHVSLSKYHFSHSFKSTTGGTVMEYVNNVRLTKVHSLLLNTDLRLEEIADATGFHTAINLSRSFKKVYGMSPRDFRCKNKIM